MCPPPPLNENPGSAPDEGGGADAPPSGSATALSYYTAINLLYDEIFKTINKKIIICCKTGIDVSMIHIAYKL